MPEIWHHEGLKASSEGQRAPTNDIFISQSSHVALDNQHHIHSSLKCSIESLHVFHGTAQVRSSLQRAALES